VWHACRLMKKDASDGMSDTAVLKFPGLLLFRFRLYMPSFALYTNGMLTNVLSFAFTSIFNHTAAGHPKYTIRDAILTCARKPT